VESDERGMTYVMRELKGWSYATSHQGASLPIRYAGPNTFPWELEPPGHEHGPVPLPLSGDHSKRNRVLLLIRRAHSRGLLSWIDSGNPEVQGHEKINRFLASVGSNDLLSASDRTRGGRAQSISSHSIRRAAVSMAMAAGARIGNITRYVHWRDNEMPWTYIDTEYVVAGTGWESFFGWLTGRIEQNS
jgi:hypothetical protein